MFAAAAPPHPVPHFVHYLPIASTAICIAFLIVLVRRASQRGWAPHMVWWGIGVATYGLGTLIESIITLHGNSQLLNTLWLWAGAILGGYPLATGSLYLLAPKKTAHILTAISLTFLIVTSVLVFMAPVQPKAAEAVRPSGDFIVENWQWVRLMSIPINTYAAIFLIGGAAYSSFRFAFPERDRETGEKTARNSQRALGTGFIAVGALLPGIGGGMAKAGITEALYIGEFVGIIFIWIGNEMCIGAPKHKAPDNADVQLQAPEPS